MPNGRPGGGPPMIGPGGPPVPGSPWPQLRGGGGPPFIPMAGAVLGAVAGGAGLAGMGAAALGAWGAATGAGEGVAGAVAATGIAPYGIGGPGQPEPAAGTFKKSWVVKCHSKTYGSFYLWFYQMWDGWTICYNVSTNSWTRWKPKKPIVFYRGKLTLSKAVMIQRHLDKLWRRAAKKTKAIKMA